MTSITLPGAHAALVGPDGLAKPYFWKWLVAINQGQNAGAGTGAANTDAIKTIALRLGSPDGSVAHIPQQPGALTFNGGGSIDVDTSVAAGIVNITLKYDTEFPGVTTYYGAGPDGARGWFPVSGALADSVGIAVVTDPDTGISSFDLKPTGVDAGTYGGGVRVPVITVAEDGRVLTIGEQSLIAGNGISFDIDPDTGAVTISVNSFVADNRITRSGDTRVTRNGDIRVTR